MNTEFEPVIGLEIHVQLGSKTKLFCSCPNGVGDDTKPNTAICPVCAGHPGVLPVLTEGALELAVRAGLSMNCKTNETSSFSRKHYFYPDLPKGYQITQNEEPKKIYRKSASVFTTHTWKRMPPNLPTLQTTP